MGMYAEILAIGGFKQELVECFEYPEKHYAQTLEGAPMILHLFGIVEGSSLSWEFASFFGITNAWDFNQHKIDSS